MWTSSQDVFSVDVIEDFHSDEILGIIFTKQHTCQRNASFQLFHKSYYITVNITTQGF